MNALNKQIVNMFNRRVFETSILLRVGIKSIIKSKQITIYSFNLNFVVNKNTYNLRITSDNCQIKSQNNCRKKIHIFG